MAQYGHTPTAHTDVRGGDRGQRPHEECENNRARHACCSGGSVGRGHGGQRLNLFTFGVLAFVGVASYFAWNNPREKNAASLGVLGVGTIIFALAVFGIDGTRGSGAGLMLGFGFLLLLHSLEPVKPAR